MTPAIILHARCRTGIAIILVVFGATDDATGAKADPGISMAIVGMDPAVLEAAQPDAYRVFDFVTRSAGIVLTMLGLLVLALAVPVQGGASPGWERGRTAWEAEMNWLGVAGAVW